MAQQHAISSSGWRLFPWAVTAAMSVVVGVNVTMAVLATRTYPGDVGSDGFTLSNRYNEVIKASRAARSLGWTVAVDLRGDTPHVLPRDRNGAPLVGAQVRLSARRPLGDVTAIELPVHADAAGGFLATAALPEAGQWDLTATVTAAGATETITQRIVRK